MFSRRHPWVFTGAIHDVTGSVQDGDILPLHAQDGEFLARGYFNSRSQIAVHVLTWDEDEPIESEFWAERLERAIAARLEVRNSALTLPNACRLVNAENDMLPGLVVDKYGDFLVLQALTVGIDVRKRELADLLMEMLSPRGIYERSDADVRNKEGLPAQVGVLAGEPPPELVEIEENGKRFLVDVMRGHKTGFYLDQRSNRALLAGYLAAYPDREQMAVLNCFSYTGGFSVYAAGIAGSVVNVDSSADSVALGLKNLALNGLPARTEDQITGDVFTVLRKFRTEERAFDLIVLDPPKFAQSQKQVEGATRGYKDINLLAFQLLKPGGLLFTFSCSGLISPDLFQKVVFGALADSRRDAQIIARMGAGADHPVALTFPEGEYLKGLICRVW